MTEVQVAAAPSEVDDDPVHMWCEWCDPRRPFRAICGADLRGEDYGTRYAGPVCPRCEEFCEDHFRVLHGD